MRNGTHPILLPIVMVAVLGAAVACDSKLDQSLKENLVRGYADAATETCLQGLSNHHMAMYTERANYEFKAAVTQDMLDTTAAQVDRLLGVCRSIEFPSSEEQEDNVIFHYKADFAKGKVGIRMVLDEDQRVAGQWFE